MKLLLTPGLLTALAMQCAGASTDFEAYGYANSPRDYFAPIDGYVYLPGATILDVSPASSVYGWLAPAHSGRFVLADSRTAVTVEGPEFDSVEFWIRSWIPGTTGGVRVIGSVGTTPTYAAEFTYDDQWRLVLLAGHGMNSVRIGHSSYVFLDDISFATHSTVVPEPAITSLVFLGLSVLAAYARVRRSRCAKGTAKGQALGVGA